MRQKSQTATTTETFTLLDSNDLEVCKFKLRITCAVKFGEPASGYGEHFDPGSDDELTDMDVKPDCENAHRLLTPKILGLMADNWSLANLDKIFENARAEAQYDADEAAKNAADTRRERAGERS